MAVVINEVEVSPAERKAEKVVEAKSGGEQPTPDEHEINRLVEQQISRCERVWAH
jgi:hypothetical protein